MLHFTWTVLIWVLFCSPWESEVCMFGNWSLIINTNDMLRMFQNKYCIHPFYDMSWRHGTKLLWMCVKICSSICEMGHAKEARLRPTKPPLLAKPIHDCTQSSSMTKLWTSMARDPGTTWSIVPSILESSNKKKYTWELLKKLIILEKLWHSSSNFSIKQRVFKHQLSFPTERSS